MGFVLVRPLNQIEPPSRVRTTRVRIQESTSMMETHWKGTAEPQLELDNPPVPPHLRPHNGVYLS